jgi:hypothetical protein
VQRPSNRTMQKVALVSLLVVLLTGNLLLRPYAWYSIVAISVISVAIVMTTAKTVVDYLKERRR